MTSQRVAPMPKAASRILGGTELKASRDSAETVGRIMIVRTRAARQQTRTAQRGAKERQPSQVCVAPVGKRTDSGNEHKEPPQAIDYTRNGRQQFDNVLEYGLECGR